MMATIGMPALIVANKFGCKVFAFMVKTVWERPQRPFVRITMFFVFDGSVVYFGFSLFRNPLQLQV
jgi:hypothetical protein